MCVLVCACRVCGVVCVFRVYSCVRCVWRAVVVVVGVAAVVVVVCV